MRRKILFVCLGNICRSPIAEGVFAHLVRERGLEDRYHADSAGTGDWHVGQPPDPRATDAAKKNGVHLPSICRQVSPADFGEFDLIVAMDRNNHRDLMSQCPAPLRGKIKLMRDYDMARSPAEIPIGNPAGGKEADVPDPYYGGPRDFENVFAILKHSCSRLLDALEGGAPQDHGAGV
jgi:protein-tyrosine phosphatase